MNKRPLPRKILSAIGFAAILFVAWAALASNAPLEHARGYGPYNGRHSMDWRRFDRSGHDFSTFIEKDYIESRHWCERKREQLKPGEVAIEYHRDAKGKCVAWMRVGK